MKIRNIYYTEQQIKKLEEESKIMGITVSELVRRIIDDYFKIRQQDDKDIRT